MIDLRKRRTVLYCNPFRQEISGADESLLVLLEGLDHSRFRPLVVLPGPSPYEPRYRELGVEVFHVPIRGIRRGLAHTLPLAMTILPASIELSRLVERERVDILHTNMSVVLHGGIACRLSGVPSVYHVRSTSIAQPRLACDLLVRSLEIAADRIIAVSESIAEIFRSRNVRRPLDVVSDALNLTPFDAVADVPARPAGDLIVGNIGRINPRKGFEYFIEAAALLRDDHPGVRFRIYGGTSGALEEDYLASLVARVERLGLGGSVTFCGFRSDVPTALGECDLFVMTSIDEGFGRVVIEAMAAGRPVIGTAIGGIRELIRPEGTGDLVPPGDPAALAAAIRTYIAHPERLQEHGRAARTSVAGLDARSHAARIEGIYDELRPSSTRPRAASTGPR